MLQCIDAVQALAQAYAVGELNTQPGTRVQLQHQRPVASVQHQVDAEVSQAAQRLTSRGQYEQRLPAGDLEPYQRLQGVRVPRHRTVMADGADGAAGGDIDAGTDAV